MFNGVATYSELVKAVTEIAGGAIGITASYASVIAKLAGDTSLAAQAAGLARTTGLIFGNVIAGIEIVHGLFVLLDPHATAQEKVDAAVGASSGAAWFIGAKVGGAAVGFAASTAIMIGYAELKYAAHLYWEANLGLTAGFMRLAYETIQRDGDAIARGADALTKTQLLLQEEKDPEKLEALKKLEAKLAHDLGYAVDYFIDDAAPHGFEAGVAYYPGAYSILREAFAPVAKYKGAKTPEQASAAARFALEKITWSIANASEIVVMSARQKHLPDVEEDLAKKQEHGGEE